jgi:hypothetical protein
MNSAHKAISSVILAGALQFAAFAAAAQRVDDPATGFGIDPPPPYRAEWIAITNLREFDIATGVNPAGPPPRRMGQDTHVCVAGFKAQPENAALSKRQFDAFMDTEAFLDNLKAAYHRTGVLRVASAEQFSLAGYRGWELRLEPVSGPPEAMMVRSMISIIETPKGRTSIRCVTHVDDFAAALLQFRAIRASVNLPK